MAVAKGWHAVNGEFSTDEVVRANKSCRNAGAIGCNAIVPRAVREMALPGQTVLDFGAGRPTSEGKLAACDMLREAGCLVTAYDFGGNVNAAVHDPYALSRKYAIVYASNVLNVQSSVAMLTTTLRQIAGVVEAGGVLVANYPASPRYLPLSSGDMLAALRRYFGNVEIYSGGLSAPVFRCSAPIG